MAVFSLNLLQKLSSMLIKFQQKKRGKVMSEHAHNICTGKLLEKREVKVMFLSMLLKKAPGSFVSMLRHVFPLFFSVASVFLRIVRQDYPSLFAIVCNYFTLAICEV